MNAIIRLDRLASEDVGVQAPAAPASSCEHEFAFVPPARFKGRLPDGGTRAKRDYAYASARINQYAEVGVRICRLCGLWQEGEPGDAGRYERGELRDILEFWGDGFTGPNPTPGRRVGKRGPADQTRDMVGKVFGLQRVERLMPPGGRNNYYTAVCVCVRCGKTSYRIPASVRYDRASCTCVGHTSSRKKDGVDD